MSRLRYGAAIFAAVAVGWAGAWLYSTTQRGSPGEYAALRTIAVPAGEAGAAGPDGAVPLDLAPPPPPRIPERLPGFTLRDRHDRPTPISTWQGKSLIINFWATWCAPCRREIPLLQALQNDWAARNFAVVGIAVDHREEVLAFADEFKLTYPLLIGEQDALDVAASLGVVSPAFPFTVFTDDRGRVVTLVMGELRKPQVELILSVVQALNRGGVELPGARRAIAEGLGGNGQGRAG